MLRGAPRRLTRTVLFTDIVGSTEMAAKLADREWRRLVARHHAVVRQGLRTHHGHEVDTAGDGFFAVFEAPTEAVRCAAAIVPAVGRLGLGVRVGIHTGDVETTGEKVSGIAVHIGARLMALAGAKEVLVSRTVKDLVAGSGDEFADRGSHKLKGVPGTWHIYALMLPDIDDAAAISGVEVEERPGPTARQRRLLGAGVAGIVLAAAIAVMVVVFSRSGAPVTAVATPSAAVPASPPPSVIAAPTQLARPLPGTRALLFFSVPNGQLDPNAQLDAGVTYSPLRFSPAFTIVGVQGWWSVYDAIPDVMFVEGPGPRDITGYGPGNLVLQMMRPSQVYPVGGGGVVAAPPDLAVWLKSRPDLMLGAATPVSIGGFSGTKLEGTIQPGAKLNYAYNGGGINLICSARSNCSSNAVGRPVGFGADETFEIIVLNVRGDVVVIAADAASSLWPDRRASVDQFLAGMTFMPGS